MSKRDEIERAYEQAKQLQVRAAADPNTSEAKRTARIAGALLLFSGALLSGGVYFLFIRESLISPLLTGGAFALTGMGLYLIVAGKMPSKHR